MSSCLHVVMDGQCVRCGAAVELGIEPVEPEIEPLSPAEHRRRLLAARRTGNAAALAAALAELGPFAPWHR